MIPSTVSLGFRRHSALSAREQHHERWGSVDLSPSLSQLLNDISKTNASFSGSVDVRLDTLIGGQSFFLSM
jgi:hypothetical protein